MICTSRGSLLIDIFLIGFGFKLGYPTDLLQLGLADCSQDNATLIATCKKQVLHHKVQVCTGWCWRLPCSLRPTGRIFATRLPVLLLLISIAS